MKYTIESLIETEREKLKFDAADFLVSLERTEPEKGYINYWEVVRSGLVCAAGGAFIGETLWGRASIPGIVGAIAGTGIGCYLEYKLQKNRR